jgi:hypothetical protein
MNNVLSTRLDTIAMHLNYIGNSDHLDAKRWTDLDRLAKLLDGSSDEDSSIKKYIRDIDAQIRQVKDILEDLHTAVEDDSFLSNRCKPAQEHLGEVLKTMEALRGHTSEAITLANKAMRRRPSVQDSVLSKKALDAFVNTTGHIVDDLDQIHALVKRAKMVEGNQDHDKASRLWQKAWRKYSENVYGPCQKLYRDYVDFLRGVATRDVELDHGICQLADVLIDLCASDVALTIPARKEALESTVTRIVRLGFCDWSIWALPLVAREVGYVVNSKDKTSERLAKFLVEEKEKGHNESHLRDYLADVFATYVMGPAYCFAAIYLHFDPLQAHQPTDSHPSDSKRAEVIFSTLAQMNRQEKDDPYEGILDSLKKEWHTVLDQSGQRISLAKEDIQQLDTWVERLYDIVFNDVQAKFPVNSWRRADELKNEYLIGRSSAKSGDDARAVLNAAWLALIQNQVPAASITELANEGFQVVAPPRPARRSGRGPTGLMGTQRQPATLTPPSQLPHVR